MSGRLYVFLCYQLVGIRIEFRRIISSFHCSNFSVFMFTFQEGYLHLVFSFS